MTIWQAVLLGIVQGVTEFLPVSSDGHLAVVQIFFTLPNDLLFNILLHLATLIAVLLFFRKEILQLNLKQWMLLALGTVPAGLVGVVWNDAIEQSANLLWFVAAGFLVTGIANTVSQLLLRTEKQAQWPTPLKTLAIGVAQSAALLPGISRSGLTVAAGLGAGLSRAAAFRFSFLLLLPAMVGAVGLEFVKAVTDGAQLPSLGAVALGMIAAFGAGVASLKLLELMVVRAKLGIFAVYCFALGGVLLLLPLFY